MMCVLLSFVFSNLKAQNDVSIDSMQYFYCQIVGTGKFMSNKVSVTIDFGQVNKVFSDQRLRDDKGEVITFNSMVDAMNWMGVRGWEFMQAYVVTIPTAMGGGQNVYHWLLKKSTKKMSDEERKGLLEVFKTKNDFKKQKEE